MKYAATVSIIIGSDSDLPIMKESAEILEQFNVPYEMTILSAHRTPDKLIEYVTKANERNVKVIIAAAGGAAHLAGVAAAYTTLPVIGVPIQSKALNGVDSLYSIVQMPPGVPVATVAINGAKNAGLLAIQILALSDEKLQKKLMRYKNELRKSVLEKAEKLEKLGYKKY
jgi:5-(carboxyamino)imidazole ribonucleotide mutase